MRESVNGDLNKIIIENQPADNLDGGQTQHQNIKIKSILISHHQTEFRQLQKLDGIEP